VSAPICLARPRMNATENLRISLSDLPFGSKSAPPLPPPMDTASNVSHHTAFPRLFQVHTPGECILEALLKAQELQDAEVHRRVESQTAFVWPKSRVVLNTEATVDLHLALVVLPRDSELDDTLWDGRDLESFLVLWVLFKQRAVLECRRKLCGKSQQSGTGARVLQCPLLPLYACSNSGSDGRFDILLLLL